MHIILIDITRLLIRKIKKRSPTGVDRVSLAYVQHFALYAQAVIRINKYSIVLTPKISYQIFEQLLSSTIQPSWKIIWLIGKACFKLQNKRKLTGSLFFNTGHSGLEHSHYIKRLQQYGIRPIFMVHDLIPITHPEYCRTGELVKHQRRMHTVLNFASGIITNSQDTLDLLQDYAYKNNQSMPAAVAAKLGVHPFLISTECGSTRPINQPYFVILSTIEPRKNHLSLLHVWRRLVEEMGAQAPRLVIIGQRGWECENIVDMLERCAILRDMVIELPRCDDNELAAYLQHAQALLFPSFAEGYGMPLVEALSLGVPVIASNLTIFKEIAGDIPEYIDPLDSITWLAMIKAYTDTHAALRYAQLKRIAQFSPPTWVSHFQLLEKWMRDLK